MDFIAKYGSSPSTGRRSTRDGSGDEVEVTRRHRSGAQIFKTMNEEHFGELSFFRVYSGEVSTGMDLFNANRNVTERMGQIYLLNGRRADGDGTRRRRHRRRGEAQGHAHRRHALRCEAPVKLPQASIRKPTIHAALNSRPRARRTRSPPVLPTLHEEDPAFLFHVDPELHQTIISAQGELHLDVVAERLRRRFNVHFELVEPRVPFRETIQVRAEHELPPQEADRRRRAVRRGRRCASHPRRAIPGSSSRESLSGQCVDRVYVPSVERGFRMPAPRAFWPATVSWM